MDSGGKQLLNPSDLEKIGGYPNSRIATKDYYSSLSLTISKFFENRGSPLPSFRDFAGHY